MSKKRTIFISAILAVTIAWQSCPVCLADSLRPQPYRERGNGSFKQIANPAQVAIQINRFDGKDQIIESGLFELLRAAHKMAGSKAPLPETYFRNANEQVFYAVINHEVAGFIIIANDGYISDIVVSDSMLGLMTGVLLLEQCLQYAAEIKLNEIWFSFSPELKETVLAYLMLYAEGKGYDIEQTNNVVYIKGDFKAAEDVGKRFSLASGSSIEIRNFSSDGILSKDLGRQQHKAVEDRLFHMLRETYEKAKENLMAGEKYFRNRGENVYYIIIDGQVEGFVILARDGHVVDLIVVPDSKKPLAVTAMLIDRCLRYAAEQGLNEIWTVRSAGFNDTTRHIFKMYADCKGYSYRTEGDLFFVAGNFNQDRKLFLGHHRNGSDLFVLTYGWGEGDEGKRSARPRALFRFTEETDTPLSETIASQI